MRLRFKFLRRPRPAALAILVVLASRCGASEPEFHGLDAKGLRFPAPVVTSKTFPASVTENVSYAYAFDDQTVTQDLRLSAGGAATRTLKQIDRERQAERFRQGNPGQHYTDSALVHEDGKLDLLIVIDDSPSMAKYQARMAPSLDPLLRHMGNADWQIGVIVTSPTWWDGNGNEGPSGCLRVNPGDPQSKPTITRADYLRDPERFRQDFAARVTAGESGRNVERGIYRSVVGLRGDCGDPSKKWLRDGANVAVLILTDEENCGSASNENCTDLPGERAEYFLENSPPGTKFVGLFYDEDAAPCTYQGWRKPETYWQLVETTGGIWGNICDDSYVPILERISAHIGPVVRYVYDVPHEPVAATVRVTLDGRDMTGKFEVVGKTIRITDAIPDSATKLEFEYWHDAVPRTSRYDLAAAAAPATLEVTVNGNLMPGTTYDLVDDRRSVIFKSMPPDDADIRAHYRVDEPLSTAFPLGQAVNPRYMHVKVDGVTAKDFIFDEAGRQVVFDVPPPDGATVEVTFETPGSRVVRYPRSAVADATVEGVSAVDAVTGDRVTVTIDGDDLVFGEDDVRDGRLVKALYRVVPTTGEFVVELADAPAEGSLKVEATDRHADCVGRATVEPTRVTIPCAEAAMKGLKVAYAVIRDHDTFTMPGEYDPAAGWMVWVDGAEIVDYTRTGSVVRIPRERLRRDAVVRIDVTEPQPPVAE